MAIVDDQGRLFGRMNLLDAVLVVLLAGVLPLTYAAYALFRQPLPALTSVEPASLVVGPNLRVKIRGQNLRPFLRVSFGDHQGLNFLFNNSTEAEVELRDMPPGTYDVVLYDYTQERARLSKAFTIAPSPLPANQVLVVGMLGNLTAEQASKVVAGLEIPGVGTVVEVSTPRPELRKALAGYAVVEIPVEHAVRVPVTLRAGCEVRASQGIPQCVVAGIGLQATMMLILPTPFGALPFQVDQVLGTVPLERLRAVVRFNTTSSLVDQITVADIDVGVSTNELAATAVVVQAPPSRRVSDQTSERDVTLTIRAQRLETGLMYGLTPLRAGSAFLLRTKTYELQGTVMQLTPEPATRGVPGR
jgi:hypothetical protein